MLSEPASNEAKAPESTAVASKRWKLGRRTLIKVMFVASLIFIMISLSFSWFHVGDVAIGNGLSIGAVDPNLLEHENGQNPYVRGTLDFVMGDGTKFFIPTVERQLISTSDGISRYANVRTGYTALAGEDVTRPDADDVKSVFVEDFVFSISGEVDMYLAAGSKVEPNPDYDLEEHPEYKEMYDEEYAKFEYVKGVARVAILKLNDAGTAYELKAVWVPDVVTKKGSTEPNVESYFTVVYDNNGTLTEQKIYTGGNAQGSQEFNGITYYWGELDETHKVSLGTMKDAATYRCVVWLDGNDRDCNVELCDQRIEATFNFLPVEREAQGTEE